MGDKPPDCHRRKPEMVSMRHFNNLEHLARLAIIKTMQPRAFFRTQRVSKFVSEEAQKSTFRYDVSSSAIRGCLTITTGGIRTFSSADMGVKTFGEETRGPVDEDRFRLFNGFKLYGCCFNIGYPNVQQILEYLKKYNIRAERLTDGGYPNTTWKLCQILKPRKLCLKPNITNSADYARLYELSFDVESICFMNVVYCHKILKTFPQMAKQYKKITVHYRSVYVLLGREKQPIKCLEYLDAVVQHIVRGRELKLRKFCLIACNHPKEDAVQDIFGKYGLTLSDGDTGSEGEASILMRDGRRLRLQLVLRVHGEFRAKVVL